VLMANQQEESLTNMYEMFNINEKIAKKAKMAEEKTLALFNEKYKNIVEHNQAKVLKAFIDNGVASQHLLPSYGYGYGDLGREVIDKVFAQVLGCEKSLVRPNFINGTHTIKTALFSVLRPNDTLLSITGEPYDTLINAISKPNTGSLADFGVKFEKCSLLKGGDYLTKIKEKKPKAVFIQKSKGYSDRRSLSTYEINDIIRQIKSVSNSIVIVDNCYGELVEKDEPNADLIAGSLIKNLGGTIAKTGGYIAGKAEYVELAGNHLTSIGIADEAGGNLGIGESILQGLWFAPIVVGEAIKTAIFANYLFNIEQEDRYDIVTPIKLNDAGKLEIFCQAIQSLSPIGSKETPIPWDMPGYKDKVIMACGSFIEGCSLEISADGRFTLPYTAYLQGGSSFDYAKYAVARGYQLVNET